MEIHYQTTKVLEKGALQELFLSVGWASGNHPDKLAHALRNYGSVFTAWDGERLIGLAGAMDDGIMTAYVHYVLIHPAYQGKGIGKQLMNLVREHYKDYLRIVLMAEKHALDFYKNSGFVEVDDAVPMYLDRL